MNNFINSGKKNTTPIKRIGLSRKRKSFGVCSGSPNAVVVDDCSENKITKNNVDISSKDETSKAPVLSDRSEEVATDPLEVENLKCQRDMKKKIAELENLYSTWRNGCKSAFLYLLEKLNKVESEKVDIKVLLKQWGVLHVMSNHFVDDSDLDFSTSDSD